MEAEKLPNQLSVQGSDIPLDVLRGSEDKKEECKEAPRLLEMQVTYARVPLVPDRSRSTPRAPSTGLGFSIIPLHTPHGSLAAC
ncbi:hypothetical protein N7462_003209 [Penicillium macrosclerotiorum]|uniref:uncharacterized protein n=1 Tax=Penicillium macrosclerotiorum TaxID=303699 RepID=UPI0025499243|nr:uncharacterized protein N7462_003209 [Penicillium macrosclerotiorum]KAJ5688817.1 hypothetical protein N7462_003209 [Penicillium macrosclerotiorum]